MTIVIFAGGAGTRLWPLSRKNSPKQFAQLVGEQSTLQLAVERVASFGFDNMFISTNEQYVSFIKSQVPQIPHHHIFAEPAKRDLAAAVCLTLLRLKREGVSGPMAILWSDHLVEQPDVFVHALEHAKKHVETHSEQFVFLGETPRFANHNLGWIHLGDQIEGNMHEFVSWRYRPAVDECKDMFTSGEWMWNPGYFVFDIDFCLSLYKKHKPEMLSAIESMVEDESTLAKAYPAVESVSFDEAIVEQLDASEAVVLKVGMGWSDPGTLYALKEAMVDTEEENYIHGQVVDVDSRDSFLYNEQEGKLLTSIGLDGVCVVNTPDALLVCKKEDVPRIKELLKKIDAQDLGMYL